MLNSLENYYIHMLTKQGLQMTEALTDPYNPIYDILIKANSNTHNPTHPRTLYPPPHYSTLSPSPYSTPYPTNGISTLSWWWGLRAPETLRAMPAVA
jgi:hypothetical protein